MRAFALVQHTLSTIVLFIGMAIWGLAATPGIATILWTWEATIDAELWYRSVALALSGGVAYLLWGMTTIYSIGLFSTIIRPRLPAERVPLKSLTTIRWAALAVLHRLATPFLTQLVPSWLGNLYFQMMGCNIGKGVQINTTVVNDCFMVSIGDGTVIGGGAAINGHLVEKGELVLAPVNIGAGCVIGANVFVSPGCKIGDSAVIGARALLPKYTEVPPGEVWVGIPAKCIRKADGTRAE